MWPILAIVALLGTAAVVVRRRNGSAPPGYERVAGAALDATASDLLASLEESGQQTLALGDYLARYEFVQDSDGNVSREIVLYRKRA